MKIKVYVGSMSCGRTQAVGGTHGCKTSYGSIEATVSTDGSQSFDGDCKKAIDNVKKIANQHGIEYEIYDVVNDRAAFRAWVDKIKTLPTVVIGEHKLEGVPSLDDLNYALEHCE